MTISDLQEKILFINNLVGAQQSLAVERYFLLDELYGSGDFNETKTLHEDIDKHYVNSVESLARLFSREENFIKELRETASRLSLEDLNLNTGDQPRKADIPKFPDDMNDFIAGASTGIYRIQAIHNIPMSDMVEGRLSPKVVTSPHSMSWMDCLHIAQRAREKNDLSKTVEWIQMAIDLAQTSSNMEIADMEVGLRLPAGTNVLTFLTELLNQSIKYHDELALKYGKFSSEADTDVSVTRIVPFNETLAQKHAKKIKKWKKSYAKFVDSFPMFKESKSVSLHDKLGYEEKINHQCQDLPQSPFIVRQGTHQCHNLHKLNPFLRLAPQMLEILSEAPVVAIFHNFLTDKECKLMQNKGRNRMKATPLTVRKGYRRSELDTYTDKRMSKIRYISHRRDDLARHVNHKISRALDFDLNGEPIPAENFQLMNYGIGRFYYQWWLVTVTEQTDVDISRRLH